MVSGDSGNGSGQAVAYHAGSHAHAGTVGESTLPAAWAASLGLILTGGWRGGSILAICGGGERQAEGDCGQKTDYHVNSKRDEKQLPTA